MCALLWIWLSFSIAILQPVNADMMLLSEGPRVQQVQLNRRSR